MIYAIRNAKQRQQPDEVEVDNHRRHRVVFVIEPIFQCYIYDSDTQFHHLIGDTAGSIHTRIL